MLTMQSPGADVPQLRICSQKRSRCARARAAVSVHLHVLVASNPSTDHVLGSDIFDRRTYSDAYIDGGCPRRHCREITELGRTVAVHCRIR
jgi:hypothetical protein